MNTELDKMAALTNDLASYAEQLERQVADLQARISEMDKKASVPSVSEESIEKVCSALVDAGCIKGDQVFQTKKAFMEDPEAIYRVIPGFIEAQAKTAAVDTGMDLNGGTLVGTKPAKEDPYDASMGRMQSLLGMI